MKKRAAFLISTLPIVAVLVLIVVLDYRLHLTWVFLGGSISSTCIQAAILVGVALWRFGSYFCYLVGGFRAVSVESWPRVLLAASVCGGASFTAYRVLLVLQPADSWRRFGIYIVMVFAVMGILGWATPRISLKADRGKAIVVITDRYKPTFDFKPGGVGAELTSMMTRNPGAWIGWSFAYSYLVMCIMAAAAAIIARS